MSALLLLALASAEVLPPPAVEVPPEPAAFAPAPGSLLEWNLGAQLTVTGVQILNGAFLGEAACGATSCYTGESATPILFGVLGSAAGLAFSMVDQDITRGWGRAALVDSLTIAGALGGLLLATRPELGLSPMPGFTLIFLTDLAVVVGSAVLARHVAPKPEAVLLADSLGLWGILLGDSAAALLGQDRSTCMIFGALAGAGAGALLAASAQRMSFWRLLIANGAALVGGLLLGGGLSIYESVAGPPSRPYNPAVPAAGTAAGIAGGFLIGFALSESL